VVAKVVLIRHGKPEIDASEKLSAADFGRWVEKYDQVGINAEYKPTTEAFEIAQKCSFIVCSSLPRSIESANTLHINTPDLISDAFRECEMPYANWKYPTLSVTSWAVLFRILQFMGYSSNAESYKAIKKRSQECAHQLERRSQEHGSVLFVGHGALIWFLHKQLLRMGWTGPPKSAKQYWEFGIYQQ